MSREELDFVEWWCCWRLFLFSCCVVLQSVVGAFFSPPVCGTWPPLGGPSFDLLSAVVLFFMLVPCPNSGFALGVLGQLFLKSNDLLLGVVFLVLCAFCLIRG